MTTENKTNRPPEGKVQAPAPTPSLDPDDMELLARFNTAFLLGPIPKPRRARDIADAAQCDWVDEHYGKTREVRFSDVIANMEPEVKTRQCELLAD